MVVLDLIPHVIAAASLAGSVVLFVLLKVEMRRTAARSGRERFAIEERCARLEVSLENLSREVADLPQSSVAASGPMGPPRPSMNLSHRAQVLRLARRGERVEQIAAALVRHRVDPKRVEVGLGLVELPLLDEDLPEPPADRVVHRPAPSVARRLDPRLLEELPGEIEIALPPRQEAVQRQAGAIGESRGRRVAFHPSPRRQIP